MNQGTPITGYRELKMTKRMKKLMDSIDGPLDAHICDLINKYGQSGAAKKLGVKDGSIWYWLTKLGVRVERVALLESQELRVVEKGAGNGD